MQLAVAYAVFITGVCIVLVIQLWLAHRRRKDVLAKLTAATLGQKAMTNGQVVRPPNVRQR